MGFSLIFFPALFTMFFLSREGKAQQILRTRATAYMVEAQEAIRSVREVGWDAFAAYANATPYHLEIQSNRWELVSGAETLGVFSRSIVFSDVFRDQEGAIVATGGTRDPSTRKATISVSWTVPLSAVVSTDVFITRHGNIVEIDTTNEDFDAGVHDQTTAVVLNDGEVVLGSTGGAGDWCMPELTITAVDLPKSGVANAISAIPGRLAAGTGENASGVSFASLLVSDPESPENPSASVSGTFDGYKTNDVFTESDYAYLATDTNNKEIVIIDLNSLVGEKHTEVGYFDAPGNGDGMGVVAEGTVGYMISGATLYSFNLTSKSGSRPVLDPDGVALPGSGTALSVVGSRAFVTTSATNAQLAIVDISNPNSLSLTTSVSLPANGGTAIYVNTSGSRAYVVTSESSSQRELFIVDIESGSPGYGTVLGSYDTNGMNPKGVITVSGPRAIVVGSGGEEYQVVDITNEQTNPLPKCGGIHIDSGINGIDTVFSETSGRAYSYIITGDSTSELKIIEGGPGSGTGDYYLSGMFTSRIFDAEVIASGSSEPVFNRIEASITNPSAVTSLSFQVAAADAVSGSCDSANYVFVGPDGTTGSTYATTDNTTISGNIPFNDDGSDFENPARCFRYQASFATTDRTLTPIIHDVTISYSP